MTHEGHRIALPKDHAGQGIILALLLLVLVLSIFGPRGVLAWGEASQLLEQRKVQIEELQEQHAALTNRVNLLNPEKVDPDLAGEEIRRNLNVIHPDEIVLTLPDYAE